MALATLIQSLKSKKRESERTTFQHYLATIRRLASGEEYDSDEVGHIIDAANKSESDLERDVGIQTQRNAWAATMLANRQAVADRLQAESDLRNAQQALQAAIDKLMPAVDAAQARVNDANHRHSVTHGAESWLAGHLLDSELIGRESSVITQLQEVNAELRPLLMDREHKQSSLMNAELNLRQLMGRNPDTWPGFGMLNPKFWSNKDIQPAEERVADLKNQVQQLERLIAPRMAEQARLQNELSQIHQQKLLP